MPSLPPLQSLLSLGLPKLDGVYIVGGSVRDLLRGTLPLDYDLAVLGDPEPVASRIAGAMSGRVVKLGKPGRPLFRVVTRSATLDVSPAKGNRIEADLKLRDFTINAMAYDLCTASVIDCTGGMQDLSDRRIRLVSDHAFKDDPIRLLRAYRLCAVLGFCLDPDTESTLRRDAGLIPTAAGERIREELFRMLESPCAHPHLVHMAQNRLLFSVFETLSPLENCPQGPAHHSDALGHTLAAFAHLEAILRAPENAFARSGKNIGRVLDARSAVGIKFALLFHDAGKPLVRTQDRSGRIRFHGHAQAATPLLLAVCRRLRFSNRDTRFVGELVRHHMRPLLLYLAGRKNQLTERGITRFFIDAGPLAPFVLVHALADHRGKQDAPDAAFAEFVDGLLDRYFSDFAPRKAGPPLLSGQDLIRELNLTPGPVFRRLLSAVEEARLSGRIATREQALDHAKSIRAGGS